LKKHLSELDQVMDLRKGCLMLRQESFEIFLDALLRMEAHCVMVGAPTHSPFSQSRALVPFRFLNPLLRRGLQRALPL